MHLWSHLFPLPSGIHATVREFDWEGQADALGVLPNFYTDEGAVIHGPVLITGINDEGDAISLTEEQIKETSMKIGLDWKRFHGGVQ